MRFIPAKTPGFIPRMFPQYLWKAPHGEKTLYLTFDDGPIPEVTEFVLDQLAKYNAKATFFCIGANVEKHPSIYQKVLANGHAIGNHTQHHLKGWKTQKSTYIDNVLQAEKFLKEDHGPVKLFRPPYGQIKKGQAKKLKQLGFEIVMWDVLTFDWEDEVSKEECLSNALDNIEDGSIIVFHDSIKAKRNMEYALPKVLEVFSKQGYQFKSLADVFLK